MTYYRKREDFEITLRTDILEDRDAQILNINQPGQPQVTIINTYNDTAGLKRRCILNRLRHLNLEDNHATIITGDFNLHHDLWAARPVAHDQLTENIVDWLSEKGFALMNPKGEITHPQRNRMERPSVIDLTFANGVAVANNIVQEWTIDPSLAHDSDHYAIKFTINHAPVEIHNITGEKYSLKDVDMEAWTEALEDELMGKKETLDMLLTENPATEENLDSCEQC
jgi:endonuclease/exonuclease/phosphatase family metal-dependent hydrolase